MKKKNFKPLKLNKIKVSEINGGSFPSTGTCGSCYRCPTNIGCSDKCSEGCTDGPFCGSVGGCTDDGVLV